MERSRKNCDRFDTLDQAREAYHEECCYWFGGYDGVGETYIKKNKEPSFEEWLFKKSKDDVTDCTRLGNAAAMREALEKTKSVIATCMEILNKIPDGCDYDGLVDEVADELCDLRDSHVKSAISAPPRNCDLLSDAQEALAAIHEDRCYVNNPIDERRLTVEWLFAEAKGDEK